MLYFNCDDETSKNRLLERGKISERPDDNIDTILKRLDTYKNISLPVVDMYKDNDEKILKEVSIIIIVIIIYTYLINKWF